MISLSPAAGADAPAARRGRRGRHGVAVLAVMAAGVVAGGVALESAGLGPVSAVRAAEAARPADPSTFGRDLAAGCAGCHNTRGRAIGDAAPIAGMPAGKMVQAMADFRDGKRAATIMQQIAKGYTPDQIRLIAEYFAAQSPK